MPRRRCGPARRGWHIEHFALTANNITYAAFGETMHYWQFFPAAEGWGCIPVWGFATVAESLAEGVAVGERFYGYLPMATHLVVQPVGIKDDGFSDGAAHRQTLPSIYNRYARRTRPGVAVAAHRARSRCRRGERRLSAGVVGPQRSAHRPLARALGPVNAIGGLA